MSYRTIVCVAVTMLALIGAGCEDKMKHAPTPEETVEVKVEVVETKEEKVETEVAEPAKTAAPVAADGAPLALPAVPMEPSPPLEQRPPEDNPGDALELTHRFEVESYAPGDQIEVVVDMNYTNDADPVTALAVRQVAPRGWSYVAVTGGIMPAVEPKEGATGTLDFVWINTPDWPNNFSYALLAPADAAGEAAFTGQGIYRASGPELRTTPTEFALPAKQ